MISNPDININKRSILISPFFDILNGSNIKKNWDPILREVEAAEPAAEEVEAAEPAAEAPEEEAAEPLLVLALDQDLFFF